MLGGGVTDLPEGPAAALPRQPRLASERRACGVSTTCGDRPSSWRRRGAQRSRRCEAPEPPCAGPRARGSSAARDYLALTAVGRAERRVPRARVGDVRPSSQGAVRRGGETCPERVAARLRHQPRRAREPPRRDTPPGARAPQLAPTRPEAGTRTVRPRPRAVLPLCRRVLASTRARRRATGSAAPERPRTPRRSFRRQPPAFP